MPTYIGLYKLTDQGVRDIKEAPKRVAAGKVKVQDMGFKHLGFYSTPNSRYDAVAIFEASDDETAAAMTLGLRAKGNVDVEIMRGYSAEEMGEIIDAIPELDGM